MYGCQSIRYLVGTTKPADDIRLGRYEDFATKNANGNYIPKQDAKDYAQRIVIGKNHYELTNSSSNTPAKNLGDFVSKTQSNGGYYIARYEASKGEDNKVKSQKNQNVWSNITQSNAAMAAKEMYSSNYVESDLFNSYTWDTAIIFIQKYSENSNYANKMSEVSSLTKTGASGDKMCNIYDMASNYHEISTEYSDYAKNAVNWPCSSRGGSSGFSTIASGRYSFDTGGAYGNFTFRSILYFK